MPIATAEPKPAALNERSSSFDNGKNTTTTEHASTETDTPESQNHTNGESSLQMAPNPTSGIPALNGLGSPAIDMAPAPNSTPDPAMEVEEESVEEETEESELAEAEFGGVLPDLPPDDEEEEEEEEGAPNHDHAKQEESTKSTSEEQTSKIGQTKSMGGSESEDREPPDAGIAPSLTSSTGQLETYRSSPEETQMVSGRSASDIKQSTPSESKKSAKGASKTTNEDVGKLIASSGKGNKEGTKTEGIPLETGSSKAMIKSLTSRNAVSFVNSMQTAGNAAVSLQDKEKKELQNSLPEIDQPTGLPTKAQKKAEELALKKGSTPDLEARGKEQGKELPTEHEQPEGPAPAENAPRFREPVSKQNEDNGSWWSRLFSRIKSYVSSLPDSDSGMRTSAGERPDVDLSGKADPKQNNEHKTKADTKIKSKEAEAQKETTKDFGEQDIYPDVETGKLSPSTQIEGEPPREGKVLNKRTLNPEVKNALNSNLQPRMNEEVVSKNQKFTEAHQKYKTDSTKEKEEGLTKIETETARVKGEQEGQQDKAAKQVDEERQKWRKENEKVKETYQQQSADKKKEIDQKIDDKVQTAEKKADKKLKDAEQEAEQKKEEAEKKARTKKQEAKTKPRSFWERVKGSVSDFFDKVRSAINTIFEGLRKLVKKIIETAKKVVKGIIELARKAVVGLIKAFGEILKKFVSIALAAFPELAKKAQAVIDKAVNKAVDLVNNAAQALKDFADKVLDAIGAALDFIITVYQKAYNAILDALEFIVIGLIEVMEGIANLVAAAKESPQHFWNAIFEELTGTDSSKPLAAIERTEEPSTKTQAEGLSATGAYTAKDEKLLKKESLSSSDIAIEPIQDISLSPELNMQIAENNGNDIEFGGAGDNSMSVQELQSTMNPQSDEAGSHHSSTEATLGGQESDFESMSDEEKLQYYLDQMNPSCEDTSKNTGSGDGGESIPDVAKVGPLSVSQRKEYILKQMKKGITNWWECNKVTIISVLIGVLLGGAILTFVTGGSFLAALPPIMKALMVIFIAEMVYRMGGHLKDYLTKSWNGDISGGAKSLAKAFAVGAVELIFEAIFKVGGKLLKVMKNAGKRLAKSMGKIAKKVAKTTVKATKTTGRAIKNVAVKGGRYTFKGLKKGFAKGARTLDDLNQRLLARFKFRKFKIKRKSGRFQLLGYLNPWVLLANGDIEYVPQKQLDKTGRLGDEVVYTRKGAKEGEEAFVVGEKQFAGGKGSTFVERYRGDRKAAQNLFEDLGNKGDDLTRKRHIKGKTGETYEELVNSYGKKAADAIKNKSSLKSNMGAKPSSKPGYHDYEAHHLIPVEAIKQSQLLRDVIEEGFEFNSKKNGKWVRRYSSKKRIWETDELRGKIRASPEGIHASHDVYSDAIIVKLNKVYREAKKSNTYDKVKAKELVENLARNINKKIEKIIRANDIHIQKELKKGRTIDDVLDDPEIKRINDITSL